MKTSILTFLLTLNYCVGFSQSPIINIKNSDGSRQTGAYYQDSNNVLNPFEGTYIYTNGNISFKIILTKKMQQYNGRYYEDLLIGEYEYKNGNTIIVSTLTDLETVYGNQRRHSISGNTLMTKTNRPMCIECGTNEFRLKLTFFDKGLDLGGSMITRKIIHNNQEAIKVFIWCEPQTVYFSDVAPPTQFRVPDGEYVLVKQL